MKKFAALARCDEAGRYEEADQHYLLLRLSQQDVGSKLKTEGMDDNMPFSGVLDESNSAWRMNSGMSPLLNQSFQGNGPEQALEGLKLRGDETPEEIWKKQQEWAQQAYGPQGIGQVANQQQEANIQIYAREMYDMYIHQGYSPAQARAASDEYVAQARMSLQNPNMGSRPSNDPYSAGPYQPMPTGPTAPGYAPVMPGASPYGPAR